MLWLRGLINILLVASQVFTLDNGLAKTPPMGWLSWERFECNSDCEEDPDNCIGEKLLMQMADVMSSEGYKDVGYEYVNVDDCWPAHERDAQGNLQPDPKRFPSGFKALADYIHSKGLKFGIYEDVGRHTCAGAPGCQDHYQVDAQTFAEWGIDMLKFDGCNTDIEHYDYGYPAMAKFLNETGRPILYSCEWPIYASSKGVKPNYPLVAKTCNTWRVYGDIWDSWQSITSILGWYGDDTGNFSLVAGPGQWNDADMLVVGNFGLSADQERVQFGMWAMLASPLLMSVDLRKIRPEAKALLQNTRVLSISQDPLGIQAKRIRQMLDGALDIWTRPVTPEGSFAIGLVYNPKVEDFPVKVSLNLNDLGLSDTAGYNVTEVFDGIHLGYYKPTQNITCKVNPFGIHLMRATVFNHQQITSRLSGKQDLERHLANAKSTKEVDSLLRYKKRQKQTFMKAKQNKNL